MEKSSRRQVVVFQTLEKHSVCYVRCIASQTCSFECVWSVVNSNKKHDKKQRMNEEEAEEEEEEETEAEEKVSTSLQFYRLVQVSES